LSTVDFVLSHAVPGPQQAVAKRFDDGSLAASLKDVGHKVAQNIVANLENLALAGSFRVEF
jgi:hypothetical protein